MDRITTHVKAIIPITYDAMSKDKRVGDSVLEAHIKAVQSMILDKEPTEKEQEDLDAKVIIFVAKSAVLEIIPSAIDYWKEIAESIVTTGTNEQETYADRIKALKELGEKLLADLKKMEPMVEDLIESINDRRSEGRPLISSLEDDYLTPDPKDIGAPYGPKLVA